MKFVWGAHDYNNEAESEATLGKWHLGNRKEFLYLLYCTCTSRASKAHTIICSSRLSMISRDGVRRGDS
jgi:hypothetical protein